MSEDKLIWWTMLTAEHWYKCEKHNIPYPSGARCPQCEAEDDKD